MDTHDSEQKQPSQNTWNDPHPQIHERIEVLTTMHLFCLGKTHHSRGFPSGSMEFGSLSERGPPSTSTEAIPPPLSLSLLAVLAGCTSQLLQQVDPPLEPFQLPQTRTASCRDDGRRTSSVRSERPKRRRFF